MTSRLVRFVRRFHLVWQLLWLLLVTGVSSFTTTTTTTTTTTPPCTLRHNVQYTHDDTTTTPRDLGYRQCRYEHRRRGGDRRHNRVLRSHPDHHTSESSRTKQQQQQLKEELLSLLDAIPANAATSPESTAKLLRIVRRLEDVGDGYDDDEDDDDDDDILTKLGGTWELIWTTQDRAGDQFNQQAPWQTFINPLEDQSYSNNPSGRSNPVLPRPLQDCLERIGLVIVATETTTTDSDNSSGGGGGGGNNQPSSSSSSSSSNRFRSTQTIDLKRRRVRNVVTFSVPSLSFLGSTCKSRWGTAEAKAKATTSTQLRSRRASLTVDIDFKPVSTNPRRIQVKFQACRVSIPNSPFNDVTIPLGFFGPTGWLETNYVDNDVRITRGHKGSVFVLKRP